MAVDPNALSAAFATIVGLLADFNSSRQGTAAASIEEFKAWLADNRHSEIITALDQNGATLRSVKTLLHQDRESLASQLRGLDEQIAKLATRLEPFQPLAAALHPGAGLSAQALSILRQLDVAGASKFLKANSLSDGAFLAMLDGAGSTTITIEEQRFLESDLKDLLDLGLIAFIETNGNYQPVYAFTRAASELVRAQGA